MTVPNTNITSGPYVGNGLVDTYDYDFGITDKSEIRVFETTDLGVQTELTVDVDYTVNSIGLDIGGTITRIDGNLPTDYTWYIRSNIETTQDTDFESQGGFFPEVHENAFDKLTRLIQQLEDQLQRSIRVSESFPLVGDQFLSLPEPVAQSYLRWRSDLQGMENVTPLELGVLVENDVVERVNDIKSLIDVSSPSSDKLYNVSSYFFSAPQSEMKGGGVFVWQEELNKNLANGATIIDPDNTDGFDGTKSTRDAFLTIQGTGVGIGCWVKLVNGFLTLEDFGSDGDNSPTDLSSLTATNIAYASGQPLLLLNGEIVKLQCNPTTGDDIQAMSEWLLSCSVASTAELYIELADGVHTVSTYIDVVKPGPLLDIRAASTADFIQINSISYAAVSGDIFEATVVVDSALPSGAVVGGPIGIQNAQGSLDVAAVNGGQIVKSIAGDRLSFTFDIYSANGFPSNGVLDNTLTFGLPANQVVVNKGSLIAQNTGWDGTSREGFMNMLNGGRVSLRYIGIAYSGAGSTEHDLIFCRDNGSRFYAYDRVTLAGAGDKVLRMYGDGEMFLNRSYVGGGAKALEIYQGTAGGTIQFVRTSCGGCLTSGLTAGSGTFINFAQAPLASCGIGARTVGGGAAISIYPCIVNNCETGILASPGNIYATVDLEINGCDLGIDWTAGGSVVGPISFGSGTESNTVDSAAPGNTFYQGGVWHESTTINPEYSGLIIRDSNPTLEMIDATLSALLRGDSGNAIFEAATAARDVKMGYIGSNFNWIGDNGTGDWQILKDGSGILVKSPDGLTTKRIGIDNAGALLIT